MTLVGSLHVPLLAEEAFRLFTATGERKWVDGWRPHFPVPVEDDAEVGTVFETDGDGYHVTWIVVDRDADRRIRYARVAAGRDAGTVEVELRPAGGETEVVVTYRLTPLGAGGERWLHGFAAEYEAFLSSWETAIGEYIRSSSR
ncbi:MAG: SRPBCC domain-containing protein [Actinoplanes sp.]